MLVTRVIASTIRIFKIGVSASTGIYEIRYAITVMGTIRKITPFTNSITGNLYSLLRYHNLTNKVARFMMHLTTNTLLGEYPNFKHTYAIGKFDKIIKDIRIWYVFIFPVACTEYHNGPCKASNKANISINRQNDTA